MNISVSNQTVSQIIAMLLDEQWAENGHELWQNNKPYLTPGQAEHIEQAASQAAEQQADPLRFLSYPGTFAWAD